MKKQLRKIELILIIFVGILLFSFFNFPSGTITNDAEIDRLSKPIQTADLTYIWNQTWGTSDRDYGRDVVTDSEGNIYVLGYTTSYGAGSYDILLLKFNSSGNPEWNITWGEGNIEQGFGVAIDSVDNIYIVGHFYNESSTENDIALVKYDTSGIQLWNQTWGKLNTEHDYAGDIAIDENDDIYITGYTNIPGSDIEVVLVKYNNLGTMEWNVTWGGSKEDKPYGVTVDSASNIYVTGYTYSFLPSDFEMFLLKFNYLGQLQWNTTWRDIKEVGYTGNTWGNGVAIDSNDYIYVTGMGHNWHGTTTMYTSEIILIKFDGGGNNIWNASWSWTNSTNSYGYDVTIDSADYLYIAGYVYPNPSLRQQMALLQYDTAGNLLWNTTWGGSGDDNMYGITTGSSMNLYVTGTTESYGPGSPQYNVELIKYRINDSITPSVLIHTYDIQAEVYIGNVNIQVNVSDNYYIESPVQIQFFEPDSTIIGTFDMNNPSGDLWNYTWDVGSYAPDINYYFKIIANDISNNVNDSVIDYFDIRDTTNPSVIIINNDTQAQAGVGLINVQINATDNYQIQSPVQIQFYEPDSTVIGTFSMNNPSGNLWNYTWDVGSYAPDTNYYFKIIANDSESNTNDTTIEYFNIIDTLNPSVVIYSFDIQTETIVGSINVQINSTDNYQIQDPVQIQFYEPDSTIIGMYSMNNPTGNLWNYTWSVGSYPPNNSYYFRIIASDVDGNINDTIIEYFNIIDTTNPSVVIYSYDTQTQAGIGSINAQVNITDNYQIQNPVQIRFYEPGSIIIGTYDMNNPTGNLWNYTWTVDSYPPN
ncbi:MAG: SBBP repeat-containing protein, partial [Promethearchaeota archaeon]